jgi:hypothetical protein
MKMDATSRNTPNTTPTSRRGLVIGAGVAGAAAVTARVLIPAESAAGAVAAPANAKPVVAGAAGYQLTQHVLRYYETTRT